MSAIATAKLLLLLAAVLQAASYRPPAPLRATAPRATALRGARLPELEKSLYREYATFFNQFDRKYYSEQVQFVDPLTSFVGVDKYKDNVDMLGGRTALGKLLFKDAGIALHGIEYLEDDSEGRTRLQTRWTLQVTVSLLPWKPRAKFTGVSIYTIDNKGIIVKQDDFWDSVNLKKNAYAKVSFQDGLGDFFGQIKEEKGAQLAAPELPYELLRRGARYEVRRYPRLIAAETSYDQRPEGYDRLASFIQGSNERDERLPCFSPTIMRICDDPASKLRSKVMQWPLQYALPSSELDLSTYPASTIPSVKLREQEGIVVAVTRFELAATEPIVRGYTGQLLGDLRNDGMTPVPSAGGDAAKDTYQCIVAQFDALFSLNKRRNEVWVELLDHPWRRK